MRVKACVQVGVEDAHRRAALDRGSDGRGHVANLDDDEAGAAQKARDSCAVEPVRTGEDDDRAQGYFVGRPVDAPSIARLFAEPAEAVA
jgi:hypothetical protein